MEHFFSSNSGGDLCSDAHQSQIIERDADTDHTQIIGGDTVKLLREIYPPTPPFFGTPGGKDNLRHNRTSQAGRGIYRDCDPTAGGNGGLGAKLLVY